MNERFGSTGMPYITYSVHMKAVRILSAIILLVAVGVVYAQSPESLDEAKELSVQQDKPVLIEFFRED